jgi:hypothetical protein
VSAPRAPVDCDPLVATLPDHPPDPMQEVALVVVQFSIALPPLATLPGVALRLTVGSGVGPPSLTTVADPPPHAVNAVTKMARRAARALGPVDLRARTRALRGSGMTLFFLTYSDALGGVWCQSARGSLPRQAYAPRSAG